MTEDEVRKEFSQYGDVNHVQILVDRETKESKVSYSLQSIEVVGLADCG